MVFIPLDIPPGVLKTRSGEGAAGRWHDCLNVQFVDGRPEKRPGFERHNDTDIEGSARGMDAWGTTSGGTDIYSLGTNTKLYGANDGGEPVDITPLRVLQSWVDKLSVTINLGAVSVAMTGHGFSLGKKFVIFGNSWQGGSAIGGLALNPSGGSLEWELVEVTDTDNFVIYPADDTGTLGADPFAFESGLPTVTVTHTGHGRATGDGVWFAGATAAHGLTIAGDYQITKIDANSYTITASGNATGTGSGGGAAVTYHYGEAATSSVSDGGGTVPYHVHLSDPFDTTEDSTEVTVSHTAHGALAGHTVIFDGATAVGGLTIDGAYEIAEVTDADSYTITAASAATSTATGGGSAVLAEYEIGTGFADKASAEERGYGELTYGSGFYGATEPVGDATYFDPRTWSVDNFGEDGVMSPLGGGVYYWDSSVGGRADLIPNAPTGLRYMFMTEERHLHVLGLGGDALLMGWCDQGNLNTWTPTDTNTANNSRRVRQGSSFVAGTPVGNGMNLLWTDTAVYTHQYTGSKFIYDTRLGAKNAGLIAPQAFSVTPIGVMWMSPNNFYLWNGSVQQIPNSHDVEEWVFANLDVNQRAKCFSYYCPVCGYVYFYFVPDGGSEPSLYVAVSIHDFVWVNGEETRTTGATFRSGRQAPYLVNGAAIYEHEVGLDADGEAAESYIELAPYSLNDWSEILGIDPDFKRQTGDVEITVTTYDRSSSTTVDTETDTIEEGAELVDLRSSGRNISLKFSQTVLAGDFAIDTPKIDVKPSGKRR